jgi:hypothetical protein
VPDIVKLFGERNTATNALKALVGGVPGAHCLPGTAAEIDAEAFARIPQGSREREKAIDAIFAEAGPRSAWKHCATSFRRAEAFDDCLVLFTVRHPASWLTGLFANPYHSLSPMPASIADFLRLDWEAVERERLDCKSFKPLELYDTKLRSYLNYSDALGRAGIPFRFIRFEDVILAQETVFRSIATDLGQPDAPYRPLLQSTKAAGWDLARYQDYYGNERWRTELEGSEHIINAGVDWDLVRPFGYSPL